MATTPTADVAGQIVQVIKDELGKSDWKSLAKQAIDKFKGAIITIVVLVVLGFIIFLAFLIAILVIVVQTNGKV